MLNVCDISKASALIMRRERITGAKWDAVIVTPPTLQRRYADPPLQCVEKFDDELAAAVEKFRKRRLADIDAKLRELGVDVMGDSD